MSIAEFPGQGRGNANPELQFERTPPQDLVAEQGVLGGMLLSKDAIADVVEIIKERDFYRPAHELIYDAILDLYGRGEPADPVTVAAELTKRGEIARAGGAPYLHTLISSVPTAANASYYARIVRDHARLRLIDHNRLHRLLLMLRNDYKSHLSKVDLATIGTTGRSPRIPLHDTTFDLGCANLHLQPKTPHQELNSTLVHSTTGLDQHTRQTR